MKTLVEEIKKKPAAIRRLNKNIFVSEGVRNLKNNEYVVVYTNNKLLRKLGLIQAQRQEKINKIIGECFAVNITRNEKQINRVVYVDRQKDPTDIALSGNEGSGRACYLGSHFNIKGVGRTSLVRNSEQDVHGSGKLDIVTAIREALVSNYFYENTITKTSPVLAVLMLKSKTKYTWAKRRVNDALLVRLDCGYLDRVSHHAHSKVSKKINFKSIVKQCAVLDAEMFSRKILHGAWSTGNLSLFGTILDMESVSFVGGRGVSYNITKKYISNYFGYESIGVLQALSQLHTNVRESEKYQDWVNLYNKTRSKQLALEFLRLIGMNVKTIPLLYKKYPQCKQLSASFEILAKKVSPRKVNQNTFDKNYSDSSILNFTKFFKNLPKLRSEGVDGDSVNLIKQKELNYCRTENYVPANPAQEYLLENAVITNEKVEKFTDDVTLFIKNLLCLLEKVERNGDLPEIEKWKHSLNMSNKTLPSFTRLTSTIERRIERLRNDTTSSPANFKKIL